MPGLELTVLERDAPEGGEIMVSALSLAHIEAHGLRGPAVVGKLTRRLRDGESQIPHDAFVQNDAFLRFLHGLIAARGPEFATLFQDAQERNGWLLVLDQRARKRGVAPTRSDVLGAFQLRAGKPVPGSYQPNQDYVVLSPSGFMRLPDDFQALLLRELTALHFQSEPTAAEDDVDPVAEADVYLAYGRIAQARQILEEALQKSPGRADVRAKLESLAASPEALASAAPAARGALDWKRDWPYVLGFAAVLSAEIVSIWFPHAPGALAPATLFLAGLPPFLFALAMAYRQQVRFLAPPQWLTAPTGLMIMAGLFLATQRLPGVFEIDYQRMAPSWLLALFLAICLALVEPAYRSLKGGGMLALTGLLLVPYASGLLSAANYWLDRSEPKVYAVTVQNKSEVKTGSRGRSHYLDVSYAGQPSIGSLHVRAEEFWATKVGGRVCIRVYPGALGYRWYTHGECRPGERTEPAQRGR
jgi:hypothetical protein